MGEGRYFHTSTEGERNRDSVGCTRDCDLWVTMKQRNSLSVVQTGTVRCHKCLNERLIYLCRLKTVGAEGVR